MSIAEDVAAVRDHIDENGWYQGGYYGPDQSCCIRGAAHRVLGTQEMGSLRREALRAYLAEMLIEEDLLGKPLTDTWNVILEQGWGDNGYTMTVSEPVAHYNDHVAKDKSEVLGFLDKAQIRAEEKGL